MENINPYIKAENLGKRFKNFTAVDGLHFTVNPGDIYAFLGPNGAGKSTTIRMLLGYVTPTSGSINLFGQQGNARRKELARVGAMIERPDFYKYLSAYKNLELIASISGVKVSPSRIYEVLEMVGLKGREKDLAKTFSQGMKQRLGIARAIMHNPELLVLDEPANGLDPQGMKEMRELIVHLNRNLGKTILLSSHILAEVELMANRMVIINKGKAVVEGNVKQLLQSGEMKVTVRVENPEKAITWMESSDVFSACKQDGENAFVFELPLEKVAALTSGLSMSGCGVLSVTPIRSLEEYFISITT
ncbi:MAG: ABC transporter ATP-binding protein [Flavobacteriales bacterium]|nr:ABC transporter ATP-binding protein [Flavobacteriales bacterium]